MEDLVHDFPFALDVGPPFDGLPVFHPKHIVVQAVERFSRTAAGSSENSDGVFVISQNVNSGPRMSMTLH
jgi:hypothetical protein